MADPITSEQIEKFVTAWFHALDIHAPIQECYKMLAGHGVEMHFPERQIRDFDTFKEWYDGVTNQFFDEHHVIQSVEPTISTDKAEVAVSVHWQASWWDPPSSDSKRVILDVTQKWHVRRSTQNAYGLEIVYYNVEQLKYAPESAHLPPQIPLHNSITDAIRLQNAEKRYAEICNNIRALDQNSFHLLQFVPLVTTAAILGLSFLNIPFLVLWLISWVGAAVTFGLYRWEMRNVQICKWLQEYAHETEITGFNVSGKTQFAFRLIEPPARPSFDNPKLNDLDTQKIFGWTVKFKGEPFRLTQRVAERIIYGATILAWLAMPVAVWLRPWLLSLGFRSLS